MHDFATADLCDDHPDVAVCAPGLRRWGRRTKAAGPAATVIAAEDNTLVRAALEEPGSGRMLVVDGLGSTRCALIGDNLAQLAIDNGWAGIIVHGCIRDSAVIDAMDVGVWALGTNPRKSQKRSQGVRDVPIEVMGTTIEPGWWCYADSDGVIVSPTALD